MAKLAQNFTLRNKKMNYKMVYVPGGKNINDRKPRCGTFNEMVPQRGVAYLARLIATLIFPLVAFEYGQV